MLDFCVKFLIGRDWKKATFYLHGNCFAGSNSSILAETPKLQRSNFWPFPTLARSKFVPSNQFLAVESLKIWSSILIFVLVVCL